MKCASLDSSLFTRQSPSNRKVAVYDRIVVCQQQEQLGYMIKLIIHCSWDVKFKIKCVCISVYCHIKALSECTVTR